MPRRYITEDCRTSRTFARTSAEAEALCHRLWTVADDYGVFPADPEILTALAFPRRPKWFKGPEHAAQLLKELTSTVDGDAPPIRIYRANSSDYGIFGPAWDRCQGTARAKKSKHPLPPEVTSYHLLRSYACNGSQTQTTCERLLNRSLDLVLDSDLGGANRTPPNKQKVHSNNETPTLGGVADGAAYLEAFRSSMLSALGVPHFHVRATSDDRRLIAEWAAADKSHDASLFGKLAARWVDKASEFHRDRGFPVSGFLEVIASLESKQKVENHGSSVEGRTPDELKYL